MDRRSFMKFLSLAPAGVGGSEVRSAENAVLGWSEPVPCPSGFWEASDAPYSDAPSEAVCSVCKRLAVLHPHQHSFPRTMWGGGSMG